MPKEKFFDPEHAAQKLVDQTIRMADGNMALAEILMKLALLRLVERLPKADQERNEAVLRESLASCLTGTGLDERR